MVDPEAHFQRLAWGPALIFLRSPANLISDKSPPANLISDKSLLVSEYAGDKLGGIWPSPTSRLGTGGFLYLCVWPLASPPLLLQ